MNVISRNGSQILTVDQVKANCRVTHSAEDPLFQDWLDIAHEYIEDNTNIVLNQSTCEQIFDTKEVNLHAPVRGIVSVTCYDSDNVGTVTTDYTIKKTHKYGLTLTLDTIASNYSVIRFVSGFGAYSATGSEVAINEGTINVYSQAKIAIYLLVNHYYENRGVVTDFKKYVLPNGLERTLHDLTKHL